MSNFQYAYTSFTAHSLAMDSFLDSFESFVGVNFFTMIFAWCNLFLLYIVLKKFLFKPVKNMIDSRQKEVDDMYSSAEKNVEDAEKMKTEYEEKIAGAKAEGEEILRNSYRKAQLREEEIIKEARAQAVRIVERSHEQAELEKKQALNEVKDEVSHMAVSIASAIIEKDLSEKEHKELIDSFIDGMGDQDDKR